MQEMDNEIVEEHQRRERINNVRQNVNRQIQRRAMTNLDANASITIKTTESHIDVSNVPPHCDSSKTSPIRKTSKNKSQFKIRSESADITDQLKHKLSQGKSPYISFVEKDTNTMDNTIHGDDQKNLDSDLQTNLSTVNLKFSPKKKSKFINKKNQQDFEE